MTGQNKKMSVGFAALHVPSYVHFNSFGAQFQTSSVFVFFFFYFVCLFFFFFFFFVFLTNYRWERSLYVKLKD